MLISKDQTMSSREIAVLTGKEHKTVMRDIRNLIDNLNKNNGNTSVPVEEIQKDYHRGDRTQYKYLSEKTQDIIFNFCFNNGNNISEYRFSISDYVDAKGEKRPQYELNKKSALLLASGYDVLLRSKIIDRWEELEKQNQIDFSDPKIILQLVQNWNADREKLIQAEHKVKILEPKAQLMDKVLDCDQKVDIGQVAKILELPFGRNILFKKLREKGIFFQNRNEPKQCFIESGYFQLKEKFINRKEHEGFVVIKVLVTQKGMQFIAKQFNALPVQKELACFA
jgi:anti-repressor protein